MTGGGLVSAPVLRPPDPAPDSTVFAYRLKSAATVATRFFQRWMVFERPATCRFAVTARSKGCGRARYRKRVRTFRETDGDVTYYFLA
jgi:hypothetical protein